MSARSRAEAVHALVDVELQHRVGGDIDPTQDARVGRVRGRVTKVDIDILQPVGAAVVAVLHTDVADKVAGT